MPRQAAEQHQLDRGKQAACIYCSATLRATYDKASTQKSAFRTRAMRTYCGRGVPKIRDATSLACGQRQVLLRTLRTRERTRVLRQATQRCASNRLPLTKKTTALAPP
jgi:hypothetical protein